MSTFKLVRDLYLIHKIKKTEKKLCKYINKFTGRKVTSVSKYVEK